MLALWLSFLSLLLTTRTEAGSSKKGFAHSRYLYNCNDMNVVTNIAWWYDWQQNTRVHQENNCTNHLNDRHFVPMVWGWREHKDYPLQFTNHTSKYVLGFNEPNHIKQGNLTPQQAAAAWRTIQARADAQNQILVSPSATKCTSGSDHCPMPGIQWFTEFFQACRGCRVDYIATHSYSNNIDHIMDWLQELWDRFHIKIWLTEVACPTSNHEHVMAFMKVLLPKLEAADHVFRYAWFSSRVRGTGTASREDSLLHSHQASLTSLGQYYQDFM